MKYLIFTIIIIVSSFNYPQDNSNNKTSICNKYKPKVHMNNLFITEKDLDGIGRYFYNNLYLPDVINNIETNIFYLT